MAKVSLDDLLMNRRGDLRHGSLQHRTKFSAAPVCLVARLIMTKLRANRSQPCGILPRLNSLTVSILTVRIPKLLRLPPLADPARQQNPHGNFEIIYKFCRTSLEFSLLRNVFALRMACSRSLTPALFILCARPLLIVPIVSVSDVFDTCENGSFGADTERHMYSQRSFRSKLLFGTSPK